MERDRHINSGRPSPYILRGLLKCGCCGFACCVFSSHGKRFYRCNNIDRLTYAKKCRQPSVPVEQIESAVWNATLDTFEAPARIWDLMTKHWDALAKSDKAAARERADIARRVEQLRKREFRGAQALLDSDLADSAATFRADLKTTQQQRRALEARLAQLQPVERPEFDLDRYVRMVDGWRKLKTPEAKRDALRQVIERVELRDREATIHFKLGGAATNCLNSFSNIRARDQENESHGCQQDPEEGPCIGHEVFAHGSHERSDARVGRGILLLQLSGDRADIRVRAFQPDSPREAPRCHKVMPPAIGPLARSVCHSHGGPEIVGGVGKPEPRRHHAHHFPLFVVQKDGFPDDL
jgi:hypothetical protein